MTDEAKSSEAAAFAMVVVDTSHTRWGEVVGRPAVGVAAPAGTPVWIVRRHQRPLRARIEECEVLAEWRVRVVLEGWGHEPLLPGLGIATDPVLLNPWPAPGPELAMDRYADDDGPPLSWAWGECGVGIDADVVVEFDRPLDPHERASLERALLAWSSDGVGHGFGRGYLHGFGPGPNWADSTLRWKEDFGSADVNQAANELAQRLAGWSRHFRVGIASLRVRLVAAVRLTPPGIVIAQHVCLQPNTSSLQTPSSK